MAPGRGRAAGAVRSELDWRAGGRARGGEIGVEDRRHRLGPGERGARAERGSAGMLSHLFVGGSHFGALTGAEIAGRDGGALGSSAELSPGGSKGC